MEITSVYHRPESEFAYLYDEKTMHIRLRTQKGDMRGARLHYGDTGIFYLKGYEHCVPMQKILTDKYYDYFESKVKVSHHRIQYIFELEDQAGLKLLYGDRGVVPNQKEQLNHFMNGFKLPYCHEVDRCKEPTWVKKTIWYQIFVDRFANGNPNRSPKKVCNWDPQRTPGHWDFYGGDLEGVIEHLDYLQDLGINGLYFCPIFESPSNHKYDTVDYYRIDPHFGDGKIFKHLVEEAHKRGMKVMLDAVFNHIGIASKYWQDVIQKGENSLYKDWFRIYSYPVWQDYDHMEKRFEQLNYDTFGYEPRMPKWNTANPEVKRYLLDIASYWIENYDIDAWRMDVSDEIDHQFWRAFRQKVTAIKPDFYTVGEVWHNAQAWLNGDEYHAVMNYNLAESIKQYFLTGEIDTAELIHQVIAQQMKYRRQVTEAMLNLLDSHDTPRILTLAKGNKDFVKAALTFLFLQAGSPCLYYGTEVGLEGGEDPDNRRAMAWKLDQVDSEMKDFVKQLIHLRRTCLPQIFGDFHLTEEDNEILALEVGVDGQRLLARFNQTGQVLFLPQVGETLLSQKREGEYIGYGGFEVSFIKAPI